MARYDKYDPTAGGFRAALAADLTATEDTGNGNPVGVSLNTSGRVVVGGGSATNPLVGVLCTTKNLKAGDIVDVMTHGDIVEMSGAAAGGMVTATNAGVVAVAAQAAAPANSVKVGFTVEAGRAVIRHNGVVGVA